MKTKHTPLYPWFAGIYPVVFLYMKNFGLIRLPDVLPTTLVILVFITILFLALKTLLKSVDGSALLTTVMIFTFFSYGQLYNLLAGAPGIREASSTLIHTIFVPIFILIAIGIGRLAWTHRYRLRQSNGAINIASIALPLIPLIMLSPRLIQIARQEKPTLYMDIPASADVDIDSYPDIYYIILDEYPRADYLLERFDYDNSEFIEGLEERGFYVADKSLSNYSATPLSLASSLNMQHLDQFDHIRQGELGLNYITPWIKNNLVIRTLKANGYTNIHISSGWHITDGNPLADINIEFTKDGAVKYVIGGKKQNTVRQTNPFLTLLIQTTLLRPFLSPLQPSPGQVLEFYHPDRTLGAFTQLSDIAMMDETTFTFMHIVKPHQPFIFEADGTIIEKPSGWTWQDDNRDSPELFIGQLQYMNSLTLQGIDDILANSDQPPIIIIQGDHSYLADSTEILNAYYLPGKGADDLYPTITPINTFRVIFNRYLGTTLELLDDRSYVNVYEEPFDFTEVFP